MEYANYVNYTYHYRSNYLGI